MEADKVHFSGRVIAVKGRIRLLRSFDQISHSYHGYTVVMNGSVDGEKVQELRVAVGPKAHEQHRFRNGDEIEGLAVPVPDPRQEWATHYKVSGLKVVRRGPETEDVSPHPEGGIAAPLGVYRQQGHRRLDPKTYSKSCQRCPWGLVMATEIIVDHWKPWIKRWRFETHCYGPRDCPRYRAGKARTVPGRKPGMIWVDDVEREAEET
jgi:hypothetical protein